MFYAVLLIAVAIVAAAGCVMWQAQMSPERHRELPQMSPERRAELPQWLVSFVRPEYLSGFDDAEQRGAASAG